MQDVIYYKSSSIPCINKRSWDGDALVGGGGGGGGTDRQIHRKKIGGGGGCRTLNVYNN